MSTSNGAESQAKEKDESTKLSTISTSATKSKTSNVGVNDAQSSVASNEIGTASKSIGDQQNDKHDDAHIADPSMAKHTTRPNVDSPPTAKSMHANRDNGNAVNNSGNNSNDNGSGIGGGNVVAHKTSDGESKSHGGSSGSELVIDASIR